MTRILSMLAVLLALAVAGAPIHPRTAEAQSLDPDAVAAEVEGKTITMGEVHRAFRDLPRQYQQQGFGAVYPALLERIVQQEVLMKRGRDAGLADDPEVEERVEELRDQVIHDVYLSRRVEEAITDEELRAEYDRFIAENPPREEVKARHILVDSEAKARDIIQQVTDGADFATLAKESSTGPSGENGGDLGWFTHDAMVPAFAEAAFGLQPNTFTADPIQTEFGWHVILVEDRRTVPSPTFEEMRPRLVERLGQEIAFKVSNDMTKQADVQRFNLDGEPMESPIGDQ
ncbi:peptidylprolyl isomerase [Marivibrio halodurans]|uniref:Parvulin-like PPIase n=1 Tax=Marivibrio halodurans TaxID=2039722 RepID=A0A8J7SLR5_9PROT|nr:peptidylprolyl isomerase [Marivibrio halodurans]MBP5856416.1 peptidylprolyl isomerase [Marivibrio halodurans]